jgi:hypothetical protein
MAVVMAIVSIVMSGTAVRAGFSLEGYILTFAPQVEGATEQLAGGGNITNNGLVGMAWDHPESGIGTQSGYWDTRDNTIVYVGNEFIAARINNNGIAIYPKETPERAIYDISDSGIVVGGEYYDSNESWNPVVWNEGLTGVSTVLLVSADYHRSVALRISSNGNIIAGWTDNNYDNGWTRIPIMWDAHRNLVLLPTVSGATDHYVTAVNDAGLITGYIAEYADPHAVVWNTGAETLTVTDLESVNTSNTLDDGETIRRSYAYGINESGIITGSITINGVSGSHGVLWVPKEGGEYDLIDVNKWAKEAGLLVDATEMVEGLVSITSIADINDSNQIVGTGYYRTWVSTEEGAGYENRQVVFLLNPGMTQVPEPGATAVVAGAAAMLACAAMRRRQRGQR